MLIIGRNPIIEIIRYAPGLVRRIILVEGSQDKRIKEILTLSRKFNISIETRSKAGFKNIFNERNKSEGISQGIVAEAEDFKYSDFGEIMKSLGDKKECVLVVLDEIQDPHNLGAIIRTSAAAGADGVIVSEKNSSGVTHTVIKSSSGAVNFIPVIKARNIYESLRAMKDHDIKVIGTVSGAKKELFGYHFPLRCAVIYGNEGRGVRKNLLKICDDVISIRVDRRVQSLNVSVAAGVVLYEILRQKSTDSLL